MAPLEVAKFVWDQFICMPTVCLMQWPFHKSGFNKEFSNVKLDPSFIFICASVTIALIHMIQANYLGLLCKTYVFLFSAWILNITFVGLNNEDAGSLYIARYVWELCVIHITSVNLGASLGSESCPDTQYCSNSGHSCKKDKSKTL